jgi:hypothetical protein
MLCSPCGETGLPFPLPHTHPLPPVPAKPGCSRVCCGETSSGCFVGKSASGCRGTSFWAEETP